MTFLFIYFFIIKPSVAGDYLNVFQRIKDQEDPVLFWQLGEFVDPDKPEWIKGQFEISANPEEIEEYRIEFQAVRGSNEMGYIAIDDIDFLQTESCEFKPEAAKPIITTTTTTPTTPQPTEPPGRKFKKNHFFFCKGT